MDRRDIVLDAAVRVLGEGGSRALTHRAVDRLAGVAEGTTSNYFRTRASLVHGVLAHISRAEAAPLDDAPLDAEGLATLAAERIRYLLSEGRTLTLARHALFLEGAIHPELRPGLLAESRFWWDLGEQLLAGLGVPDPAARARLFLAFIDGVLADQLARPDPLFDATAAVETALRGVLRP